MPSANRSLAIKNRQSLLEGYCHQGNNFGVVLLFTFETQKVVISTALGVWKLATNTRTRVIDSATTSLRIYELASLTEQRILLATKHSLFLINFCVTGGRNLCGDTEVLCQPTNISRRYLNTLINRAAVCGTVNTVVVGFLFSIRGNVAHDR